jgi:hypothetical protein
MKYLPVCESTRLALAKKGGKMKEEPVDAGAVFRSHLPAELRT